MQIIEHKVTLWYSAASPPIRCAWGAVLSRVLRRSCPLLSSNMLEPTVRNGEKEGGAGQRPTGLSIDGHRVGPHSRGSAKVCGAIDIPEGRPPCSNLFSGREGIRVLEGGGEGSIPAPINQ